MKRENIGKGGNKWKQNEQKIRTIERESGRNNKGGEEINGNKTKNIK